jgi:hypothetical protein
MNKSINLEKLDSLKELSTIELAEIAGGTPSGFWEDLFYVGAATVHFIGYMIRDAVNNPIRPSEYR